MTVKNLKHVDFASTFKNDYREYGFDVIKNRALPDIRDGLKPVHRAILTEMLTSHNTSTHKTVKVARITGSVIANWHPHGDSSVEDALAGMAVPWKNTLPPIEIKGNKGSVFGDTHAAGRYIEARLSSTGDAYGKELKEGIVEYEPNFDETKRMPKILPAQLPYLLINGDEGIGVGFASNIPTHNPIEVIKAFRYFVQHPKTTVERLMEIMPGPDFYTKGEIINKSDLPQIYKTGLGHLRVKGRMRYDKKTNTLHVYEIPATAAGTMNKLIDELTLATMETVDKRGKKHSAKITGVNRVIDHSGKDGIDITLYLKRGVSPEAIEQAVFAKTRMETTFKFDFSALNAKRLKRYNLLSYFKEYLAFQHQIVRNEFALQEQALDKRLEIIKGLLILQQVINEVIASARNANGKAELRDVLMHGKVLNGVDKQYHETIRQFNFSEIQAEQIANLPIYKINKLDYQGFIDEGKDIQTKLQYARLIMNDVSERKKLILERHANELKKLKPKEFGRKTEIKDGQMATVTALTVPETPMYVNFDKYQYVRIEEKPFDGSHPTTNYHRLGFFDVNGVCWNVHLIDEKPTTNRGTLVNQILQQSVPIIGWSNQINADECHYGLFVYENGNAKLTDMRKFLTKSKSTKVASGKSDVKLVQVIDVPTDTTAIELNGQTFALDDFSINGISGHGKHMLDNVDPLKVQFLTGDVTSTTTPTSSNSSASKTLTGNAYFNADGKLNFLWNQVDIDASQPAVYAIDYETMLKTTFLMVYADGRAKRIDGEQFKVNSQRKQIQASKAGTELIYMAPVATNVKVNYQDGAEKIVATDSISNQGKAGRGVKAFLYDQPITKVEQTDSDVPTVSLATKPKLNK